MFGESVDSDVIAAVLNSVDQTESSGLLERATAVLCEKLAPASEPPSATQASSSINQTAEGVLLMLSDS